jgi:hypothetical protein
MKKLSQLYTAAQAKEVCQQLIDCGQSYSAMPLPYDIWDIEVKDEGHPLPAPISSSGGSYDAWFAEVERRFGPGNPLPKNARGDFLFNFLCGMSPAEAVAANCDLLKG